MVSVTDRGGFLRACGAMEDTGGFGIDVAHALAMSTDDPVESYYIRVVHAAESAFTDDLILELLVGDVSLWAHEIAVEKQKRMGKNAVRCKKGFLRHLLSVLIDERVTQLCRQCKGTKYVARMEGERYKQQKMVTVECPTCCGEGVKRHSPQERARLLGVEYWEYEGLWRDLCDRIEGRFVEWDDKINRIGRYRLWSK